MASDADKKAADASVTVDFTAMQETLLKKMEAGFAAIDIHLKALEEKVIGDGLVLKPPGLQPLASSGVTAGLTATELSDTLTAVLTAVIFAVATASDTAAVGGSRGISLNKVFCTTAVSDRFLSYAPQQQQPSFPNVWPTPPTPASQRRQGPPLP